MAQKATADDGSTDAKASDVFESARESLAGVDSLAGTPWSKLFHEARTANDHISGVALPIRVRNGSLEVGEPVKTRQGQHFRANDSWDATITLRSVSFISCWQCDLPYSV